MSKILVFVGAGRWQVAAIRAAHALGIQTHALDGSDAAPGLALANSFAVVDIRDPDAVLRSLADSGVCPGGVLAVANETGMGAAAAVRDAFALSGATLTRNRLLTDKTLQRSAWDAANLPSPNWFEVRSGTADCDEILLHVGLPAIVKPADSAGSRGIHLVTTKAALPEALAHALSFSSSGKVIVEGFVRGTEYTVETFSHAGLTYVLAVTTKRKVAGTNNTVADQLRTMEGQDALVSSLSKLGVAALSALGHTDGPGHTEILQTTEGELYLVESAGRGGGFGVFEALIPAVSGFDIVSACVEQAMGWEPRLPEALAQSHAVLRFVPSQTGVIKTIDGLSRANQLEGVRAEALAKVGDQVSAAASDGDRLALILSTAPSLTRALKNADLAESEIKFELESTNPKEKEHCASHRFTSASR